MNGREFLQKASVTPSEALMRQAMKHWKFLLAIVIGDAIGGMILDHSQWTIIQVVGLQWGAVLILEIGKKE